VASVGVVRLEKAARLGLEVIGAWVLPHVASFQLASRKGVQPNNHLPF
jgi:hypothetical protein